MTKSITREEAEERLSNLPICESEENLNFLLDTLFPPEPPEFEPGQVYATKLKVVNQWVYREWWKCFHVADDTDARDLNETEVGPAWRSLLEYVKEMADIDEGASEALAAFRERVPE